MQVQEKRKHLRHNKERKIKMRKVYIIIAHTGQEIIDSTPEAQDRIDAMKYRERRYRREQRALLAQRRKRSRNLLWRFASICKIL